MKYLILGAIAGSLVILIKEIILKPEKISLPEIPSPSLYSEVQVDFDFLEKGGVQELLPFEEISLPEEIGRENPFEPY